MATRKPDAELEKIYKKYGVKGKAPSNNSDKGQQSKSAPSARTNNPVKPKPDTELEKIYKKYGVSGSPKPKINTTTVKPPVSNTPETPVSYYTEQKNALANAKGNLTNKTTITSNLTEKERKSRINEIQSELAQISKRKTGYGRAKVYGTSKYIEDSIKKDELRATELAKELKELERVGTYNGADMLDWEIDEAKRKVSSVQQEVNAYGSRPSANVAEQWRETNSKLYDAKNELEALETKKHLYDNITKFGDVVNEDDFGGQWRANYRSKELSEDAAKAFSAYMDNPTDENREIALAYDAFAKQYMKNNENALDDEGQVLPLLSKNFADYVAQLKGSAGTAVPLGLAGAAIGLLGGGAGVKAGWTAGYSLGTGWNSYNVIRGSLFNELISYGLDEETAKKLADDDATIEALIESGETAKDWAFMLYTGLGGKAFNIGSKATGKVASKAAKYAAKPFLNLGLDIVKGVGLNSATEYGEEFSQGAVSRATREKALSMIDNEIGQYGEGNIDLYNRPIYKNLDGTISTVDSITVQIDDKFLLLPSIVRDENGNPKRLETTEDIVAHYVKTGEY